METIWERARAGKENKGATRTFGGSSTGFVDRHPGSGGSKGQQSAFSSSYVPSPKFGGPSPTNYSDRHSGSGGTKGTSGEHKQTNWSSNYTPVNTNYSDRHTGSGGTLGTSGEHKQTNFNSTYEPTITIHNDEGDQYKGNSGSDDHNNWKFGSITTKNGSFLNTEDEEVMGIYRKINKLKQLNPGWTDIDAANYLNYGTTDRKHDGKRGKRPNAGSEDILKDGLMNTWGMGIRGDRNFGQAMDVETYSNGLDWVSANPNGMSAEDIKIQRAILDSTKKFKAPSKFGEFFKNMPTLTGIAADVFGKIRNMQPTRESFDTEIGSPGWDSLAVRQLQRIELMPDGSSPYDYLKKHQNEDYNKLANKYIMVKPDEYKPMTWWKERPEAQKKGKGFVGDFKSMVGDLTNLGEYEEKLVGVSFSDEETGKFSNGLHQKIKTELDNANIDSINGIRVDGDIVNLNKTFRDGPELNSNDKEIKESAYTYNNHHYAEEETIPEDKPSESISKYINPADRAGGFEALFGIPFSPLGKVEPDDIKAYLGSHVFGGRSYSWDASLGKYRVFDESKGLSYITPDEARLELDL